MWIYKIKNTQNGKLYIGQSIRPIEYRFQRHINDAESCRLNTHFARAIRKYGKESFTICVIDIAHNQAELNYKEQFWIQFYDSINFGYNETDAIHKCGGNTYKSKTVEEMKNISIKIAQSKTGGKNPNARKVKMTDVLTNEVLIFNSQQECADYLQLSSHMPVSRRCRGECENTKLLNDRYMFEYYNEKSVSTIPDECTGVG